MDGNVWQLQEAKSKFSQLVEEAMHKQPQVVTKHGHNAVVILSFNEYISLTKPKTDLVTFLRASPMAEEVIDLTRNKDIPRDVNL